MNLDDLRHIVDAVGERRGWDFGRVRDWVGVRPWSYAGVVRRYLTPEARVLDLGTGGGETFIRLAAYAGSGVGIDMDPAMIVAARANTPPELAERVTFEIMPGADLKFPTESFDVVLNRHAPAWPEEIARVLKPGGVFITQQIGARNTANICLTLDCDPPGQYGDAPGAAIPTWAAAFRQVGCSVRARGSYDVPYVFLDVESLVFWLKSVPVPPDFDVERHGAAVLDILARYTSERGIETNVHREFLIVQKEEE